MVAISVGVLSVAVGIGIPVFYETQIDNAVSVHSSSKIVFFFFFLTSSNNLIFEKDALVG